MSSKVERWEELSGLNNWDKLLDPLASDLRQYLIHYGSMVGAVVDAFINEPASKNVGLSRYAKSDPCRNWLCQVRSFKQVSNFLRCIAVSVTFQWYEITKYFYAPSTIPTFTDAYYVIPTRDDAVLKESNWMGYVAVATDEGTKVLGRRDILIAWRGTARDSEHNENFKFNLVKAPLIFGGNSSPMVHSGWYNMYTTINKDSVLNNQSARDQIRDEVQSLIEKYKGETISISVAGHSLGGSLATLTAVDLAANPFDKDILVTAFLYASPNVGDDAFVKAFNLLNNLRALRMYNPQDIVPKVPPLIFGYGEVGVGFEIKTTESEYIRELEGLEVFLTHDLMVYLHGIDGYVGSGGGFELHGDFGVTELNKDGDFLIQGKDGYFAPIGWGVVKNKGMVQQDDGTWILDDHEIDETF